MKYKIRNKRDLNLPLMELIFKNRKVDYSSREEFFNPSANVIQDPFVYDRMMDGINSFVDALRNKERFGVLVDCDCDGYCSAAIVINYMKDNFGYYIVHDDSIKKDESINEFIDLDDEITAGELHDIMMEQGGELLVETIDKINRCRQVKEIENIKNKYKGIDDDDPEALKIQIQLRDKIKKKIQQSEKN